MEPQGPLIEPQEAIPEPLQEPKTGLFGLKREYMGPYTGVPRPQEGTF